MFFYRQNPKNVVKNIFKIQNRRQNDSISSSEIDELLITTLCSKNRFLLHVVDKNVN